MEKHRPQVHRLAVEATGGAPTPYPPRPLEDLHAAPRGGQPPRALQAGDTGPDDDGVMHPGPIAPSRGALNQTREFAAPSG